MNIDSNIFFAGRAVKTVDNKRRVNIPAYLVNQVKDKTFHITRGQDQNLFVFPREIFFTMASRLNMHYGFRGLSEKEKRLYFFETMSDAHPVQCDQQGRISIPRELLDFAKIKDKVLIIGAFDKLIFWNPEIFEAFVESGELTQEERVNRFGWVEREQDDAENRRDISRPSTPE